MKIVGCEFSKYTQLLEGRQKKIRRYQEENIKPLLTTAQVEETQQKIVNSKEQIKGVEESTATKCANIRIQRILELIPNRQVTVIRTDLNKCQIREKGTKKVIYEGTSIETLQQLEKILGTLTELNKRRILEIVNTFPPDMIRVEIKDNWCWIRKKYSDFSDMGFHIDELTRYGEDNLIRLSKDANGYYQEKIKTMSYNKSMFEEVEKLLAKSKYNWMKVQKTVDFNKWQIIDRRDNRVRFEGTPEKILETVREITKNK